MDRLKVGCFSVTCGCYRIKTIGTTEMLASDLIRATVRQKATGNILTTPRVLPASGTASS
jgi:hypothetical protein